MKEVGKKTLEVNLDSDLIFRSDEAVRGGYASIIEIEGTLSSKVDRVISRYDSEQYQAELTLLDAEIIEMEEGVPEPDLPEGAYTYRVNVCKKPQVKPSPASGYVAGILKSAEALAKARGAKDGTIEDLFDTRVAMRKEEVLLFESPERTKADGTKVSANKATKNMLIFKEVGDSGVSDEDISDYIKTLVVGSNPSNARRLLSLDSKAKKFPEYLEAVKVDAPSFADSIGLTQDEKGIFIEKT